ncbi:ROK family protein [Mucilaginibacter lappiensis]|uniref:NBD/HSP70 family sugar kinase n=1 Tax=Mucilaginibacter lappiensis TaxID=354630 RepID=A0A1N7BST3_9SPHI|nr:ROK family protein [Mucilaginibacter lappiensis]MBB6110050.1 putative NBD/HSP70 family sugar kinase [Mucilaginibacter lappiensis]MBB6126758.1 putative NBD/HSP70 family sugar kinase [Mucilaginibacter lappiensis]SIR54388.1 Sugar kinase of the NBD/HSP70 family, may contain an N-terminal HTH domain [Mucilaginibacter lappiensis]
MFFKNIDLIKALYYSKTASLNDLSIDTGRSIPYVTKGVADLVKLNIVKEIGIRTSSGGRKPATYSLIADTGFIISVAMNQFVTRIVIVNMNNEFVGDVQEFELKLNDNNNAIHSLIAHINATVIKSGLPQDKFLAVGITMPGFIDAFQGNNLSFLQSPDETLVTYIAKQVELPVFIENDSTSIALAEQKFGLPIARSNSMIINLGWGIGLGMIINKEIFKGHSGFAGEFSHLPLHKNGKLCSCGKQGCLETEASLLAIEAKATEGLKQGEVSSLVKYDTVSADNIIDEALKGDAFAVKIISEAAYFIGQGLAILLHLMNPESIILSGKGSVIGKLWLSPIQQAMNEHCIPHLTTYTQLAVSNLGNDAQLLGGVTTVIENLYKLSPQVSISEPA